MGWTKIKLSVWILLQEKNSGEEKTLVLRNMPSMTDLYALNILLLSVNYSFKKRVINKKNASHSNLSYQQKKKKKKREREKSNCTKRPEQYPTWEIPFPFFQKLLSWT